LFFLFATLYAYAGAGIIQLDFIMQAAADWAD